MQRTIRISILIVMTTIVPLSFVEAKELLQGATKIIPMKNSEIPQAPRVSPDGKQVLFEYYSAGNKHTSLWLNQAGNAISSCLSCDSGLNLENGYWHPSGNYIVTNEVQGNKRGEGQIIIGELENGKLHKTVVVGHGSRAQFSSPYGHVIFFEKLTEKDRFQNNILSYRIIGAEPLQPVESKDMVLRGQIKEVMDDMEISHPSLAPDGVSIIFSARGQSANLNGQIYTTDGDRQKIFSLWKHLATNKQPSKLFRDAFARIVNLCPERVKSECVVTAKPEGFRPYLTSQYFFDEAAEEMLKLGTLFENYNYIHLYQAWVWGLMAKLDLKYVHDVEGIIYPRLWTTDVFGAPIKPLVEDLQSAPLPQKWATVSKDGSFAVFEAGHYTDRHIYLVMRKGNAWSKKAIRLTQEGTYNSSPEVDPTGNWLYFESNRDKSKGIWRAKLDWTAIKKSAE